MSTSASPRVTPLHKPQSVPKRARSEDESPRKRPRSGKELAVNVTLDGEAYTVEPATFDSLPSKLRKLCVDRFPAPMPIQAAAWPLLLDGKDVVGVAKTGSGKTLAFAVPFLAMSETGKLERWDVTSGYARMVCLAPTRELAQQIGQVVEEFANLSKKKVKYPVVTIVGGLPKRDQCRAIAKGCDIVCCTPGRLEDLVSEGAIDISHAQFCVLDEADRMLDMGFRDVVKKLVTSMPKTRQTVLFSATWPDSVKEFARGLMGKHVAQVVVGSGDQRPRANESINQIVECMQESQKWLRLKETLKESKAKKTLVFGLYKKETAWLAEALVREGYKCGSLHGDMTQEKRNDAIQRYKAGKLPMIVATDVAGRGLDVEDVELVVNYTFPLTIEDYIHRIGRTGRAGKDGKAITFFCEAGIEKPLADDLATVLRGAKQSVPEALDRIANGAGGHKASKKKEHSLYGAFFKDAGEMAKLEAKKVHLSFDSDDE